MARQFPTLTRNGFVLPSNIKASYEGAGEGRRSTGWDAPDNGINSINMAEATSKISKEADPEKAKAMMASLEESLRTGDLFADMQVKAALSAYMQNKALYSQLKNDSREASGILDKNLAERRESSSQKWAEMAQSMDDATCSGSASACSGFTASCSGTASACFGPIAIGPFRSQWCAVQARRRGRSRR